MNTTIQVEVKVVEIENDTQQGIYQAPLLWNHLPDWARGEDTLSPFKSRLKTYWNRQRGMGDPHNRAIL